MKKAFSLVELIVVIGIIGILAGVLLSSFSGGSESARAAKCLNNMRNLAQGALSYAARSAERRFPVAGSCSVIAKSTSGLVYKERVGWISWLSENDEYGTRHGKNKPKSFISLSNVGAYCDDDRKAEFAITNGVMWQAVNCNRDIYVCPHHQIAAQKKGAKVRWSYVMNAYFGYDFSDGSKAVGTEGYGHHPSESGVRAERRLMFAELPIYGSGTSFDEGGKASGASYPSAASTDTDCVLQYKAYDFNKNWKGKAESIAFNHKSAKRYCAHVAFADGHTEKLVKPGKGSGVSEEQLTALLCAGKDISFDGSSYTWVNSQDKTE